MPRGAHLYIKGWLPSHINVAVTANEMRAGRSVSVCRRWHQPSASRCNRKRCGGERCREVRITELNASEAFDEVSLNCCKSCQKSVSDSTDDKQFSDFLHFYYKKLGEWLKILLWKKERICSVSRQNTAERNRL